MCQFEDMPIISKYTRDDAVTDGLLVEFMRYENKPVMTTVGVRNAFGLEELLTIWHDFRRWKDEVEPYLPEEEKLFSLTLNGKKIWVEEDGESYTILFPSEH